MVPLVGVCLVRMACFSLFNDHSVFVNVVVPICYWFCSVSLISTYKLNSGVYERKTNCSSIFRTSSKLQHAQHMHLACHICTYANAGMPTLFYSILLLYSMYRNRHLEACRSEMVRCMTVKLRDHVDIV